MFERQRQEDVCCSVDPAIQFLAISKQNKTKQKSQRPGMAAYTCSPGIWKVEAGCTVKGSRPFLAHDEFEDSLEYTRPCLKQQSVSGMTSVVKGGKVSNLYKSMC